MLNTKHSVGMLRVVLSASDIYVDTKYLTLSDLWTRHYKAADIYLLKITIFHPLKLDIASVILMGAKG